MGSGAYAVVYECTSKANGRKAAVKVVERSKLTVEDDEALKEEVAILRNMKHDHIVQLFDFYQDRQKYYLVLEICLGGELFDRIVEKKSYNEKEARDLVRVLFDALHYCHQAQVVHRDLKPENLLLEDGRDDANIKLADFGFAQRIYTPNSLTTQCGTPGYVLLPSFPPSLPPSLLPLFLLFSCHWCLLISNSPLPPSLPPTLPPSATSPPRSSRAFRMAKRSMSGALVSSPTSSSVATLLSMTRTKGECSGMCPSLALAPSFPPSLLQCFLAPFVWSVRSVPLPPSLPPSLPLLLLTTQENQARGVQVSFAHVGQRQPGSQRSD